MPGWRSVYRGYMRSITLTFSPRQLAVILLAMLLIAVFLKPGNIHAQRAAPVVAQVGASSPLPVYVVNELPPLLPEGFTEGTSWKFSTSTYPSTLTYTFSVQKAQGGWALLTVTGTSPATPRWYYIPQMAGTWEQQP
jgi:hypothetical protein